MSALFLAEIAHSWWPTVGAPLANHLWQSTLFAAVAALLTLLLRNNHARTRHALWFLASVKFLVPFSLLVDLGSRMGWSRVSFATQTEFLGAMGDFGQPFAPGKMIPLAVATATSGPFLSSYILPIVLLLVWVCGFAAVLFYWWSRSRRVHAAIRRLLPAESGREMEALRRVQSKARFAVDIGVILTRTGLEPGIFGVFRPVLLLPEGISERLSNAQLDAIIAHELCHGGRRDNLTATLHMLVEALFWFYPLVWWLGTRLVDERERACDEEVLRLGSDPQTYAESILKVCEFYLESPFFSAAGVTGSNLKKRIEVIMQNRTPHSLDLARKLLLGIAGLAAVSIPLGLGLLHPAQILAQSQNPGAPGSPFESVYLQPNETGEPLAGFTVMGRPMHAYQFKANHFMATNVTLQELVHLAYQVQDSQISSKLEWFNSAKFDVDAKLSSSEIEKLQKLAPDPANTERQNIIEALLKDQFKLDAHRETRQLPVYALVIAQNGPRLQIAKPGDTYPNGFKLPDGKPIVPGLLVPKDGQIVGQGIKLAALVNKLSKLPLGRPILDKTGLTDNYDFTLVWTPAPSAPSPDATIFAALEQQLGLKLEPEEAGVEMLVVDRAEKPIVLASKAVTIISSPEQPAPEPAAVSDAKVVLGDLKIDGKVHDPDGVRDRILNTWKDREYSDAQKLMKDVAEQGIRRDFQDRGYFKVQVNPAYFKIYAGDADGILSLRMTVSILEGNQYRLGILSVHNIQPDSALTIPPQTIRDQFHIQTGDLLNVSEIRSGIENVVSLYHAKGYTDSNVEPATDIDEVHHVVDITFRITEGRHKT